jgi:hypothetical protein
MLSPFWVENTQLGPIDRASNCLRTFLYRLGPNEYVPHEDGDRAQSPKQFILHKM